MIQTDETKMRRFLTIVLFLTLTVRSAVQDAPYRVAAQIKPDGTVVDASSKVVGDVKGCPMEWAAIYFFIG